MSGEVEGQSYFKAKFHADGIEHPVRYTLNGLPPFLFFNRCFIAIKYWENIVIRLTVLGAPCFDYTPDVLMHIYRDLLIRNSISPFCFLTDEGQIISFYVFEL